MLISSGRPGRGRAGARVKGSGLIRRLSSSTILLHLAALKAGTHPKETPSPINPSSSLSLTMDVSSTERRRQVCFSSSFLRECADPFVSHDTTATSARSLAPVLLADEECRMNRNVADDDKAGAERQRLPLQFAPRLDNCRHHHHRVRGRPGAGQRQARALPRGEASRSVSFRRLEIPEHARSKPWEGEYLTAPGA